MNLIQFVLLLIFAVNHNHGMISSQNEAAIRNMILEGGRLLKRMWSECSTNAIKITKRSTNEGHFIENDSDNDEFYRHYHLDPKRMKCLKQRSMNALNLALDLDVIPIYDGIELVRYKEAGSYNNLNLEKSNENNQNGVNNNSRYGVGADTILANDWKAMVVTRLVDVFRTHVVRINIENNDDDTTQSRSSEFLARRRHRRHSMMPIFIFGTVAMALILIPMGFKFLAVLGGKALLLAKMALLLASIQGLKRIATSNLNYGLYHVPTGPHGAWHDRHSRLELYGSSPYPYDNHPLGHQPDVQLAIA